MVKADIVRNVSDKTGVSRVVVSKVLESIIGEIVSSVAANNFVTIRGFGVFSRRTDKPRTGRNFNDGGTVSIPERTVPTFIPSETFKKIVEESVEC